MKSVDSLRILAVANLASGMGEILAVALLAWSSMITPWIALLLVILAILVNTVIGIYIGTVFNSLMRVPERAEEKDREDYLEVHR